MLSLVLALRSILVLSLLLFIDELIICIGNLLEENDNWNWNFNRGLPSTYRPDSHHQFQNKQNKRLQVCDFCLFFTLDFDRCGNGD